MTEKEEELYKRYCPAGASEEVKQRVIICVQCAYFNPIHRSKCPYCSCDWGTYVQKPEKHCVKHFW
jgi:uncharacterized paraquat-inducible protein A